MPLREKNSEGQRRALVLMRKSGGAEDVRVEQDMDESYETMLRCDVGVTEELKVEVGLHPEPWTSITLHGLWCLQMTL